MSAERWQRLRALYDRVTEASPGERERTLRDVELSDPSLHAELLALLASDAAPATFLESPAARLTPSPLLPGQRVGAYEIVAPLGAGGMGEVYRARDTNLQRDVAVKVLPAALSADQDRTARFVREAQVLAALNHPNIAHVYGFESGRALVMELVEGETLADRIARGPIPLDEALPIARQIADALEAAHERGVIHRDLKPANIKLRNDGTVKVLDFGLAKLVDAGAGSAPPLSHSPTFMTPPVTEIGVLLGTAAYMSPEQAKGQPVDARADIWAFGVIVYEMLTRERLFEADTVTETLAAVLTRPISFDRVPEKVRMALSRCLERDPRKRLRHIGDFQLLVDGAANGTKQGSSRTTVMSKAVVAVSVTAVALAIGAYWLMSRDNSSGSASATPATLDIVQFTTEGDAVRPAVSSDGRYVAYLRHGREALPVSVWIRQQDNAGTLQLVAPEPGIALLGATFTPDGANVDVVRADRAGGVPDVWRVPFLGGTPRLFARDVWSPIAWAPNGRAGAFIRSDRDSGATSIVVIDASGQRERILATRQRPARFLSLNLIGRPSLPPAWSPDSARIAAVGDDGARGFVSVINAQTGSERVINAGASRGVAWLDTDLLLLNNPAAPGGPSQLWRVALPDPAPVRLTSDLNGYEGLSVSAGGLVVAERLDARMSI